MGYLDSLKGTETITVSELNRIKNYLGSNVRSNVKSFQGDKRGLMKDKRTFYVRPLMGYIARSKIRYKRDVLKAIKKHTDGEGSPVYGSLSEIINVCKGDRKKTFKVDYSRLSREDLRKLMNDIIENGVLPPEDHALCRELVMRKILDESVYAKNTTAGLDSERMRSVFEYFGIENHDSTAGKFAKNCFNLAYRSAVQEKNSTLTEGMAAPAIKSYLSEDLTKAYAKEKGIPPEEAWQYLSKVGIRAFGEGFKDCREKIDWTDLCIALAPAYCLV